MEDMTARAQSLSEMATDLQKVAGKFKIDNGTEQKEAAPKAQPSRPVERKKSSVPLNSDRTKVPVKVKEALEKRGIEVQAD